MESFGLTGILAVLKEFGPYGLLVLLWWMDNRRVWSVLDQYKTDMLEQREMYKNNVKLVEVTQQLADDLKSIVVLNIQKMTEVNDAIDKNQFCPAARIRKTKAIGLVGEREE